MPKVQIWIDEKEVWAEEGSNLLEAALAAGIHIPHLCHDPRLKPFGSCRLCFVEIEGRRGPVPACGNIVQAGMKVTTNNETIRALRKKALELLMTEHCGDCVAPCQLACPAHIDIQGFIAHIANGRRDAAAALIKEQLPFPSVCGRVCPRFCEAECRRNIVDEPVNICALKRYAGDYDLVNYNKYAPTPLPPTGKTVAVVGGGPAGLTAAYYLALMGHAVTIYDRGPELGGMLRYGIPEYRLPKATLDQEIKLITDLCAEVRLGQVFGRDFTLESLQEAYDAVFLGLGSQAAQMLGLENEDTPGILNGIGFLRAVAEGNPPDIGRNVVVVGGGNTAMDAARTAIRLGAENVTVVYRRGREEMPANIVEIEEAEEEGVKFQLLANPTGYICSPDHVEGVECVRMELGEPDASGRRRPIAVQGSEFTLPADTVILAIGQKLQAEEVTSCGLLICDRGNVKADENTGVTSIPGVFAAGDCVTGPKTVVEAVGAAKRVALAMDQYLRGVEITPEKQEFNCTMGEHWQEINPAYFADREKIARRNEVLLKAAERKTNFKEFNLGLTPEMAKKETERCLSCGCQDAFDCKLRLYAGEYEVDIKRLGTQEKRYEIITGDYIVQDENKCILCGNCVRICQEVQDNGVMGFVNRGFDTTVKPNMGVPLAQTQCESCGQCLSACPTGALTAASILAKPGPFKDDRVVTTTCTMCNTGCTLELHIAADTITKVTSPLRTGHNDGNLCNLGRFADRIVHDENRLTKPLVRDGATHKEVSWEKAVQITAGILAEAQKYQGADGIAVLVSPALTNEENYLAQKFARTVLGTNNIESTNPVPELLPVKTATFAEVEASDYILLVGEDITLDFPIVAQKIRKAVENGAQLVVLAEEPTRLDKFAHHTLLVNFHRLPEVLLVLYAWGKQKGLLTPTAQLPYAGEDLQRLINALPNMVRVKADKVTGMLADFAAAKRPVIIANGDSLGDEEHYLLNEILAGTGKTGQGSGLVCLYRGGNAYGQTEMGVHPDLLPGRLPVNSKEAQQKVGYLLPQLLEKASRNEILALVILGDDFILSPEIIGKDTMVVVAASTWRDDLALADVVLPLATFAESDGTVINCEGRLLPVNAALEPFGGKNNLEIIYDLAKALGKPLSQQSAAEILAEAKAAGALQIVADDLASDEADAIA